MPPRRSDGVVAAEFALYEPARNAARGSATRRSCTDAAAGGQAVLAGQHTIITKQQPDRSAEQMDRPLEGGARWCRGGDRRHILADAVSWWIVHSLECRIPHATHDPPIRLPDPTPSSLTPAILRPQPGIDHPGDPSLHPGSPGTGEADAAGADRGLVRTDAARQGRCAAGRTRAHGAGRRAGADLRGPRRATQRSARHRRRRHRPVGHPRRQRPPARRE